MRHIHHNGRFALVAGFLGFLLVSLIYGCASENRPAPAAAPAPSAQASAAPAKGRAQIWADNCVRCHNSPPPDRYSDAEWAVAMQHMRVRGYLTGQEHKAVEEFLKAGN